MIIEQLSKGALLLAREHLDGTEFDNALILLVAYDIKDGAFGLVLNHPAVFPIQEVFSPVPDTPLVSRQFYIGGPVDEDALFMLINGEEGALRQGQQVVDEVYIGGEWESVEELLMQPEESVGLYLGYSGWDPGQLENEVREKSWDVFTSIDVAQVIDAVRDGRARSRSDIEDILEKCRK